MFVSAIKIYNEAVLFGTEIGHVVQFYNSGTDSSVPLYEPKKKQQESDSDSTIILEGTADNPISIGTSDSDSDATLIYDGTPENPVTLSATDSDDTADYTPGTRDHPLTLSTTESEGDSADTCDYNTTKRKSSGEAEVDEKKKRVRISKHILHFYYSIYIYRNEYNWHEIRLF